MQDRSSDTSSSRTFEIFHLPDLSTALKSSPGYYSLVHLLSMLRGMPQVLIRSCHQQPSLRKSGYASHMKILNGITRPFVDPSLEGFTNSGPRRLLLCLLFCHHLHCFFSCFYYTCTKRYNPLIIMAYAMVVCSTIQLALQTSTLLYNNFHISKLLQSSINTLMHIRNANTPRTIILDKLFPQNQLSHYFLLYKRSPQTTHIPFRAHKLQDSPLGSGVTRLPTLKKYSQHASRKGRRVQINLPTRLKSSTNNYSAIFKGFSHHANPKLPKETKGTLIQMSQYTLIHKEQPPPPRGAGAHRTSEE